MALRSLTTRTWGRAAAYALRRHPGSGVPTPTPPPPPPPAAALSRSLGTTRGQNDIDIRRTPIDLEHIRGEVKRWKTEDEIMRENLRWSSRFYKTLEWSCYVILSVTTAGVVACRVVVQSRKDKGHVRPT